MSFAVFLQGLSVRIPFVSSLSRKPCELPACLALQRSGQPKRPSWIMARPVRFVFLTAAISMPRTEMYRRRFDKGKMRFVEFSAVV